MRSGAGSRDESSLFALVATLQSENHSKWSNPQYQNVRGQLKVHLDDPQGFALLVEVGADLGGARVLGTAALLAHYIYQLKR